MTSRGQCPRGWWLVNVFTPLKEILYPRLDRDPPPPKKKKKSFTLFRPLLTTTPLVAPLNSTVEFLNEI